MQADPLPEEPKNPDCHHFYTTISDIVIHHLREKAKYDEHINKLFADQKTFFEWKVLESHHRAITALPETHAGKKANIDGLKATMLDKVNNEHQNRLKTYEDLFLGEHANSIIQGGMKTICTHYESNVIRHLAMGDHLMQQVIHSLKVATKHFLVPLKPIAVPDNLGALFTTSIGKHAAATPKVRYEAIAAEHYHTLETMKTTILHQMHALFKTVDDEIQKMPDGNRKSVAHQRWELFKPRFSNAGEVLEKFVADFKNYNAYDFHAKGFESIPEYQESWGEVKSGDFFADYYEGYITYLNDWQETDLQSTVRVFNYDMTHGITYSE